MKRIFSPFKAGLLLLLTAALIIPLAGCGSSPARPAAMPTNDPTVLSVKSGVSTIAPNAYQGKLLAKTAALPDTVTEIGNEAFARCKALESVTLSRALTSIGQAAFMDCDSLASVVLPDSLTTIGNRAFSNCKKLTALTLPPAVKSVGTHAFDGSGLKTLTVASAHLEEAYYAFCYCGSLESVTLPEGLAQIADGCFLSCTKLAEINFPTSLTKIGAEAFRNCFALSAVALPAGVTEIGDRAFASCHALTAVTLPDGLTFLHDRAFTGSALLAGSEAFLPQSDEEKAALLASAADLRDDRETPLLPQGAKLIPLAGGVGEVWGELFCLLPPALRTVNCAEADYALVKVVTYEERSDYSGKAYNTTTSVLLRAEDGTARLLFSQMYPPPFSGYGTLRGREATTEEIWAALAQRFAAEPS